MAVAAVNVRTQLPNQGVHHYIITSILHFCSCYSPINKTGVLSLLLLYSLLALGDIAVHVQLYAHILSKHGKPHYTRKSLAACKLLLEQLG